MALLSPSHVWQGYWVDHSQGSMLGATITLDSTSGNIVIAFVSGLIGVCGVQFWGIIAFTCYVARTSNDSKSGLYHQQQLLLRNTTSPGGFILEFGKLGWFWRRRVRLAWLNCFLWMSLALGISLGFIIAGTFSSRIVTSKDIQVLIKGDNCTNWSADAHQPGTEASLARQNQYIGSLSPTLRYARTCYNITGTRPACHLYVTPSLPLAIDERTECPFDSMCDDSIQDPGVLMDTGALDTNDMFGVNAQPENRITIRKASTCAVISQDGYFTINTNRTLFGQVHGRDPLPGEAMYSWNYGGIDDFGPDTTALISTYASNVTAGYSNTFVSYGQKGFEAQKWQPVKPFQRADADVVLLFIFMNRVSFVAPCDDPLFSAHVPKQTLMGDNGKQKFLTDKPAGVVGCAEQYQICNPSTNVCTELTGSKAAYQQASERLALNTKQNTTLELFADEVLFGGPNDMSIVGLTSPAPLLASSKLKDSSTQYPLPSNQWEIEIHGWMYYVLAQMQKLMASRALGYDASPIDKFVEPVANASQLWICGAHKMAAQSGFSNVSVFGLSFAVAICCVIILVNTGTVQILRLVSSMRKSPLGALDHWRQDGVLHVQKKAYEALGVTSWEETMHDVPVTQSNEQLTRLWSPKSTIEDPKPEKAILVSHKTM